MKAIELIEILARAIREHGPDIPVVAPKYNSHYGCTECEELSDAEVSTAEVGNGLDDDGYRATKECVAVELSFR